MLINIKIHSKYKWIAKDACGIWSAYGTKPKTAIGNCWRSNDDNRPPSSYVPIEVPELQSMDWEHCCFELVDGKIKIDNLKKDTPVLVKDYEDSYWNRRYFHSFNENGGIRCYQDGCTSWSSKNQATTSWKYWKLPTEEE